MTYITIQQFGEVDQFRKYIIRIQMMKLRAIGIINPIFVYPIGNKLIKIYGLP